MKWRGARLLLFALVALPLLGGSAATTSSVHGLPATVRRQPPVALTRPAAATSTSSDPIRRIGHARPGLGGMLGGSQVTSGNWAGYDVTGGGFTSVSATWIQPPVQPNDSSRHR